MSLLQEFDEPQLGDLHVVWSYPLESGQTLSIKGEKYIHSGSGHQSHLPYTNDRDELYYICMHKWLFS